MLLNPVRADFDTEEEYQRYLEQRQMDAKYGVPDAQGRRPGVLLGWCSGVCCKTCFAGWVDTAWHQAWLAGRSLEAAGVRYA
jgi:hypothetical protein